MTLYHYTKLDIAPEHFAGPMTVQLSFESCATIELGWYKQQNNTRVIA